MSEYQPLPGPWHTDAEHEHVMVFAANKIAVADCAPYYASPYQAVCEANARLIATAPELLASLRDCFALAQLKDRQKDDPKLLDEILGRAFEAIRKAEGR